MQNRREILKGISAIAAVSSAAIEAEASDIDAKISKLRDELARKRGGTWLVRQDEKSDFVLFYRKQN